MRMIRISIAIKDIAMLGFIAGTSNGFGVLATVSGIVYSLCLGLLIFSLIAFENNLRPLKRYKRKVDRLEDHQKDQDAHRDLMDKTNNRRLSMLEKRSSQNIHGKYRRGDTIYEFRKEA